MEWMNDELYYWITFTAILIMYVLSTRVIHFIFRKKTYRDKKSILYYVYDEINELYKIGITSQTVEIRFSGVNDIDIIKTWTYKNFDCAYKVEQGLHKKHKKHRVFNKRFENNGGTEFFSKDVLNLDKKRKSFWRFW